LEIAERRERLQTRIDTWNKKAEEYLHSPGLDDGEDLLDILSTDADADADAEADADVDIGPNEDTDDDTDADTDAYGRHNSARKGHPQTSESFPLYFPSSFALHRFPNQARKELELRQGQANDSLHNLRIALGKKSFLFRSHVRAAKSQQRKTRAWSEVSAVDGEVRQQARIYNFTRQRMIKLSADPALLDRYKVLRYEDLKVSTAIATPNARGQRDTRLSWFWNMDVQADAETDDWMEECKPLGSMSCPSPSLTFKGSLQSPLAKSQGFL
jgi:hypothetical protein